MYWGTEGRTPGLAVTMVGGGTSLGIAWGLGEELFNGECQIGSGRRVRCPWGVIQIELDRPRTFLGSRAGIIGEGQSHVQRCATRGPSGGAASVPPLSAVR